MNLNTLTTTRRYELDWLRVIAILLVFLVHSGRFFDTMDWHVKNPVTYRQLEPVALFAVSWIMPLIFVISGASVFYAVGKSGSGKFLQSKVFRLLVPLIVGIFSHLALQVYLERITHHQFFGTFWEFIPHYFQGLYGFNGGNFPLTGMHLWYLLVLFIFTLFCAPLFRWLRRGSGQVILRYLSRLLSLPGAVYMLALPLVVMINLLDPRSGVGSIQLGGWSGLLYLLFYLGGFLIYADAGVLKRVQQYRWLSLVGGVLSLAILLQQIAAHGIPLWGTTRFQVLSIFFSFNSWFWVLTFMGFAQQHLTFSTPFMQYANEAVLPFYIMHQTVLLCVGFFVVQWPINDLLTWLFIAASSLAIIMFLYEFLIRRHNVLRFLFGMKPLPQEAVSREPSRALAREEPDYPMGG